VLGLGERCGVIVPGHDADFVVLDDDLRVVRVMAGGAWCDEDRAASCCVPLSGGS